MKAKSIGVFEAVCAASLVASARTDKAPVAPGWSTIPVLNAQAGRLSIVDLSNFVSGWPAPDFDLVDGDATIEGEFLKFTPSATGMGTIVVCASNRLGTANATLTFEAGELAPKKFAVCVGINEYEEISSLSGCVNDARYMAANLVERGGWDAADVTLLIDSSATKSAIRGAISNVAEQAMAGDVFVYQHSSHGGQFNATDDDEDPLTGEDGLDTFLCVHDEVYYDNTTAYNDYEIAADMAASVLAGSADRAVVEHVVGVGAYSAYRNWALSVKASGGDAPADAQSVRASPRAWLSFAFGSDALIGGDLADGGVRIEGFESTDADGDGGRFALEVSVDGVSIGSSSAVSGELLLANLAEALAVEGAETPDPYAFDSEGVETWVCPPVGGRARLEASPPDGADAAFFFRVRVHE